MKNFSSLIPRDVLPWFYGGMMVWELIKPGLAHLHKHPLCDNEGQREDKLHRGWTVFEYLVAGAFLVTGGMLMYFHFTS